MSGGSKLCMRAFKMLAVVAAGWITGTLLKNWNTELLKDADHTLLKDYD